MAKQLKSAQVLATVIPEMQSLLEYFWNHK